MKGIISCTDSGLGNRIKSLASILDREYPAFVYWPLNGSVDTKYCDLFEDSSIEVHPLKILKMFISRKWHVVHPAKIWFSPYWAVDNLDLRDFRASPVWDGKINDYRLFNDGLSIDYMYDATPRDISETYRTRVHSLEPKRELREIANEFCHHVLKMDFVGAHLRTWQSEMPSHNEARRHRNFNGRVWNDLFQFHQSLATNNVYVATDCERIAFSIFDGRKNVFSSNDLRIFLDKFKTKLSIIQFAFVEILILSKSKFLFASEISSFSEVAWYYNDEPVGVHRV